MICRNCNTEFSGNFCPNCGAAGAVPNQDTNVQEKMNAIYNENKDQKDQFKENENVSGVFEFNTIRGTADNTATAMSSDNNIESPNDTLKENETAPGIFEFSTSDKAQTGDNIDMTDRENPEDPGVSPYAKNETAQGVFEFNNGNSNSTAQGVHIDEKYMAPQSVPTNDNVPFYKKPFIYIPAGIILFIVLLIIIFSASCRSCHPSRATADIYNDTWPSFGLCDMLPKPETDKIHISSNSYNFFSCDAGDYNKQLFDNYVSACMEKGFTENYNSSSDSYYAENSDGYFLDIDLYTSLSKMSITLSLPEKEENNKATKDEPVTENTTNIKETEKAATEKETQKQEIAADNKDKTSSGSISGYLDVKYKTENGKAVITGYSGSGDTVSISSEYDDCEVTEIADSAFENCKELKTVLLWADIEKFGDSAFKNCTSLTDISIPSDTVSIGAHAFENCSSMDTVILWGDPDIGDYAFSGCTKLGSISIGSDTKNIGDHAFENCTKLEDIIFWGGEDIGEYAFSGCTSIKDLSIPSETKRIRAHAFDGCSSLESVYSWSDDTKIDSTAFDNCPKLKERP